MWLQDDACRKVVQSSWDSIGKSGDWNGLTLKIKACSSDMERWNHSKFGQVQRKLRDCTRDLESLKACPQTEAIQIEEAKLISEMEEWLERRK
ncbi:hypothetical protein SLE2022_141970 [Rubroshorea leprosula]